MIESCNMINGIVKKEKSVMYFIKSDMEIILPIGLVVIVYIGSYKGYWSV